MSVMKLKKAINHLQVNETEKYWSDFMFTRVEFRKIEAVINILEELEVASKKFKTEKTPTLNWVVYQVYNLCKNLKKMAQNSNLDT